MIFVVHWAPSATHRLQPGLQPQPEKIGMKMAMKKFALAVLLIADINAQAFACNGAEMLLRDRQGNIAHVKASYDCWEKDTQPGKCFRIHEIPKSQSHLKGFRSHHVVFQGREYAFVESWRRGAPSYVTGAFGWDRQDVAKFVRVPIRFTAGEDREMNFSFSSKMKPPPFESLTEPPQELDGKDFVFARCK